MSQHATKALASQASPESAAGGGIFRAARLNQTLSSGPGWLRPGCASGRPNQAIAAELVVTLDTVKKHVSHVLGKLGAANRTEAVARGRELGLIP